MRCTAIGDVHMYSYTVLSSDYSHLSGARAQSARTFFERHIEDLSNANLDEVCEFICFLWISEANCLSS